jgi:DNA polymerase-3 subunit delta
MFENQKIDWIKDFFKKRGIEIDQEAVLFILEMIRNNTKDLKQECGRLADFFGEGANLRVETIEKYLYHSKEENVFSLFERIAARDLSASEEVLAKILLSRESHPASLLTGLLWQFRNLMKMKALLSQNYSAAEAFTQLHIRSKKSQRIYEEANRRYSLEETRLLIRLVHDFEIRVRNANHEISALLLQLFVYYAVQRGGQIPQITSL